MTTDQTQESDSQETSEIPASLVDGSPQPGDTISLTVVGVNTDAGTVTVSKSASEEEGPKGSDAMASEFDQQPETST